MAVPPSMPEEVDASCNYAICCQPVIEVGNRRHSLSDDVIVPRKTQAVGEGLSREVEGVTHIMIVAIAEI